MSTDGSSSKGPGRELRIKLGEAGADAERLDTLTRQFYRELKQLNVDGVATTAAGGPIANAKGIDAASAEAILVAVGTALQGLSAAVMLAREWRKREPEDGGRKVHLEIDGDVLELPCTNPQEEQRLIDMFLRRHAAKAPE